MGSVDPHDERAVLTRLKAHAAARRYRLNTHAERRQLKHDVTLDEIFEAVATAQLLENYPSYYRDPACLIYGDTAVGRPLHIVCSTTAAELVNITVYEPTAPKWVTPTRRGET